MELESVSLRSLIVALLALALPTLAGCSSDTANQGQGNAFAAAPSAPVTGRLDRSHAGSPAPAIRFEDPNGQPTSLAAYRGRPVLLNLWATWCGPCIVEMPSLNQLAEREGDALEVVTLSQDIGPGARALVTQFFARVELPHLEAHLDSQMEFMRAVRADTLPTTILYDAEGREVWRMTGKADWMSDRAARLLTEAEAG